MAISRRALVLSGLAVGGGLGLIYLDRRLDDGDAATAFAADSPDQFPLNAWLRIGSDGFVTCAVHRAEMGQGVTTTLPMLLAEELDADWQQVRYAFPGVDRDYFNFGILLRGRPLGDIEDRYWAGVGTGVIRRVFHAMGMSMTISSSSAVDAWDTLRPAGAAARAMLVAAAARQWNVAATGLTTDNGRVLHPATGQSLGYGELAAAAAQERPPASPPLKDPGRYRFIGRAVPRLDVPAKVDGSATFALDTRSPGMLFGAVRHGAVAGGRITAFDDQAARAEPGVEAVIQVGPNALAVLARNTWSALQAADRLVIDAAPAAGRSADRILDDYRNALDDPAASVFRDDEGIAERLDAGPVLEAQYTVPYLAHACMEPMNCTALADQGRITVWAPTQANSIARDVAARVAGVDPAAVTIHRTLMGGGFGRRAEMDFVEYAVAAAMATPGRPVQLCYSREEDLRHDMYRPAGVARLRGVLGTDGRIAALDYTLAMQSVVASYFARTPTPRGGEAAGDGSVASGVTNPVYGGIPVRVRYVPREPGVPVGYWRSTGNSYNGFFVESFMDELAAAAGADPVEFRLRHLDGQPAHRAVLQRAAERAGWGRPLPAGHGRGVALIESHGSICAQVAEVALADGRPRVRRITCVLDCRTVLHPDIVRAQMESAIVDGLGATLWQAIGLADGRVVQGNFDTWRMPRLADVPELDIELLPQGGRPGGVGEPGVPAVAPAIANAIHAAGGGRRRALPLAADAGAA